MKVNANGQIRIPAALREKAGFAPGSEVEFVEENGRYYLRHAITSGRGKTLVRQMTGKGDVKMSTDEIMALMRGW